MLNSSNPQARIARYVFSLGPPFEDCLTGKRLSASDIIILPCLWRGAGIPAVVDQMAMGSEKALSLEAP